MTIETKKVKYSHEKKTTTKCFQNRTRSFFHFKIKHMVLQYKQEFQNMNHEKPLLCHVFQLKFGQVYSVGAAMNFIYSVGRA